MKRWDLQPAGDLGMPAGDRLRSLRRENGLISTALHGIWWFFVRNYLRVWHRLTITGQQHLPTTPPFILVANHASHLDTLALAAPLAWRLRDRIFPIAAGDVFFQTPLASAFAAWMLNALPMWRKKCGPHAMAELRRRLTDEPCAYILFPEGTRSRDGRMMPFKPGLGMLVAGARVPIIPCYLAGCHRALAPGQRWPRPGRIHLQIGEPIVFDHLPNDREGWQHISQIMEERIRTLQESVGAPSRPTT